MSLCAFRTMACAVAPLAPILIAAVSGTSTCSAHADDAKQHTRQAAISWPPRSNAAPGHSALFSAALDCKRKSCEGGKTGKFMKMFQQMDKDVRGAGSSNHGSGGAGGAGGAGGGVGATEAVGAAATQQAVTGRGQYVCPSKDDIGMCTWSTVCYSVACACRHIHTCVDLCTVCCQLHLIASQYPEHPDEETKQKAIGLVEGLAWFYPCPECREDFREAIAEMPPR